MPIRISKKGASGGGGSPVDGLDVDISHTNDSVRLGDGTNFYSESNPIPVQDKSLLSSISNILRVLMSPFGYDKTIQRYRATTLIESGTVTTVSTVTTATNLVNLNGRNADMLVNSSINAAWALNVRNRIT